MATKKRPAVAAETTAPSEGDAHEGAPETNGEKKAPPAFKVGPIVTAKGECLAGCVWEREFSTPDGRTYKVHSLNVEARYFSEKDGVWRPSSGFRASQLSALEYILRRCSDFVFAQRDTAQKAREDKPGEEI